jgi:ribosome-interacting GTPase 1
MIPKLKICHRRKIERRINKVCFRMNVQKFDVNLREPRISKKKRKGVWFPQIHQLQHTDQNLITRPIFKVRLRLCTLWFTESNTTG